MSNTETTSQITESSDATELADDQSGNEIANGVAPIEAPAIEVEVAYALPDKQKIISLKVPKGTTAMEAAELSGIAKEFPDIDLDSAKLGLFGKHLGTKGMEKADIYQVKSKDRIEIYRPLIIDPKEVRRRRAEKKKLENQENNSD